MAMVTFLSDCGLDDDVVGVCHGVIAGIAPDVRVIDITPLAIDCGSALDALDLEIYARVQISAA